MSRFGDKLASDVLVDDYFAGLNKKVIIIYSVHIFNNSNIDKLTDKEFSDVLRFVDILSNSTDSKARNKAYSIISLLYETYKANSDFINVAYAVFVKLGLFVSCKMLDQDVNLPFDRKLEEVFKMTSQATPDGKKIFTDSQSELFSKLYASDCFSFSGPTSMGKSFLIQRFIEKLIIDNKFKNLVIIVPTRALITQFSQELYSEFGELLEDKKFKIFTNSNVVKNNRVKKGVKYIFVLTPERLHSYLSQKGNPKIDVLFVDEAHKLASNDDRSITEYSSLDIAIKTYPKIKIFFASPNIENPNTFLKLFHLPERNSFSTIESPVAQNLYLVNTCDRKLDYIENGNCIEIVNVDLKYKGDILTSIYEIGKKQHSNLVYCNSPDKVLDNAREFCKACVDIKENKEIKRARRIIKDFIHKEYYLREFLKKGVAYHHGKLPQAVRNIVEELFRKKDIRFLFCTSTLLEGVNLPTKNMFIIPGKRKFVFANDDKNLNNTSKNIDFWNLAGRAGRFNKEFSGNVFCYSDQNNEVSSKILNKELTNVVPLISKKIEDKNLEAIEQILKNGISDTKKEQKILEYIANIICIDTLRFNNYKESFILKEFIDKNKVEIIDLAKKKANTIKDLPMSVLTSYKSLGFHIQNDIFSKIKQEPQKFKLPKIEYDTILKQLELFFDWYEWDKNEKDFRSSKGNPKNKLKYWAFLMNNWVADVPLNMMISNRLKNKEENGEKIMIDYGKYVPFDINNPLHINLEINSLLKDIESGLRFKLERYFNHYHQLLVHFFGENKAGINWATYLEYGTKYPIKIALQNIGLSRHTANTIYKNFSKYLIVENDLLIDYKKVALLKEMKTYSKKYYVEIDEISKLA